MRIQEKAEARLVFTRRIIGVCVCVVYPLQHWADKDKGMDVSFTEIARLGSAGGAVV